MLEAKRKPPDHDRSIKGTLKGCRKISHPFRVQMKIINLPEVFASLQPPATILATLRVAALLLAKTQSDLTMYEQNSDTKREMLRHTVATLAYRGGKTLRGAPDGFSDFRSPASGPRSVMATTRRSIATT